MLVCENVHRPWHIYIKRSEDKPYLNPDINTAIQGLPKEPSARSLEDSYSFVQKDENLNYDLSHHPSQVQTQIS